MASCVGPQHPHQTTVKLVASALGVSIAVQKLSKANALFQSQSGAHLIKQNTQPLLKKGRFDS
jgi:hypothetical protein